MNNIQAFTRNEKNIRRLIYTMTQDDCETCPAFSFCKKDAKRKIPRYEDCSDSFVAWAMAEKK